MKKVEINNYEELFQVLDRLNESIDWNTRRLPDLKNMKGCQSSKG